MEMREYDITSHKITVLDADDAALDLTDFTVTAKTRGSDGGTVTAFTGITYESDDPTTGVFFVKMDLVDTPLDVGRYIFEIYLDGPEDAETVIYESLVIKESFAL